MKEKNSNVINIKDQSKLPLSIRRTFRQLDIFIRELEKRKIKFVSLKKASFSYIKVLYSKHFENKITLEICIWKSM